VTPTRRGALLVAAAALLCLLPALVPVPAGPVWMLCLVAPLLAFAGDALLCNPSAGLAVTPRVPEAFFIGDTDEVVLGLAAPGWRRPAVVEAVCDLDELFLPAPPARGGVPAHGTAEARVPLVARRRGTARVRTAWLRWTGPLGLVQREDRREIRRTVAVVPNVRGVRSAALRFSAAREFLAGPRIARHQGEGSEFESLREYQAGLDPRAIDWKASARHARLLGRQYRAERHHQIVLCVDTGHLMSEPIGGMPRLDHAIIASLLLGYVALKTGDRLALFAFDERVRLFTDLAPGAGSFAALRRRVAELDYSSAETNFTLGLVELDRRLRRRSLLIVLTEFVDTVTAELMVDNLGRVARRHLVVFVALRDPELERLVEAPPRDLHELNRAVAARDLVRERDVVLSRLRRHGVLLVDARPREVSTALVNRYLDLKRREKL
jgi:uncharacterized protein (DUF58 family)